MRLKTWSPANHASLRSCENLGVEFHLEEVDWWKGGLEDFRIALDQAVYIMISRNVRKMYNKLLPPGPAT